MSPTKFVVLRLLLLLAIMAVTLLTAACSSSGTGDDTPGDSSGEGGHDTAQELGEDVQATVTLEVTEDEAPATAGHEHGDAGAGDGAMSGKPTQYDAAVADAAQTITVEVEDGAPAGGVQRVEVALGSVVALMVTSDTAEEVHVHGYDILRAVSDGNPAHFAFTAAIPGVFEVEFEGSGRLLLQLEVS